MAGYQDRGILKAARDDDDPESRRDRSTANLALLARMAEAEAYTDRGGTTIELEQDAWRAIEALVLQAREDLQSIYTAYEEVDDQLRPRGADGRLGGAAASEAKRVGR